MSYKFIAALILLARLQVGHAAYYAPDVMENVIAVRQAGRVASPLPAEAPERVTCFVATDDCAEVGEVISVWHPVGGWERCWVTDCCCVIAGDCDRMRKRHILVEVDYRTAARWGVLGHGPDSIVVAIARQR
jgi:hypothetical protein